MTWINGHKQIIISLLVFLILLSSSFWFVLSENSRLSKVVSGKSQPKPATLSAFKEASKPIYLPPVKVLFGKKVVDVEAVGVEDDGTLSVPTGWQGAGWYKKGAQPGEPGNVIIDGHYDTNTGAPAAFWELKDLQLGDTVTLTDVMGRNFIYLVNGKSYIDIKDPERSKVFDSGKDKVLTLITCGGIWDYASGTYNKRLVITAIFDKMEKSW